MSDVYIGEFAIIDDQKMMSQVYEQQSATWGPDSRYEYWVIDETSIIEVDPLLSEEEHFLSIRSDLMKDPELKDEYVAILNHKVIGHDPNGAELALKMYREHGYIPILIEKVSEDIKYTSSPQIE